MDWNKQMSRELKKAGLEFKLQKVSKERCASFEEVEELNQRIKSKIEENNYLHRV